MIERPDPVVSSDAKAVVLGELLELKLDDRHGCVRRQRLAVRILKPAGLGFATFMFQLEASHRLRKFSVWTLGPGREAEASREEATETALNAESYSDVRTIALTAPEAHVGDVVAAEWLSDGPLPFPFEWWQPSLRGLALARGECRVQLPKGWELRWRATGLTLRELPAPSEGGRGFAVGPLAGRGEEPEAPQGSFDQPLVAFRFLDPSSKRTFEDWNHIAGWYFGLSAPAFAADQVPGELVARASGREPLERLRAAAHEVQKAIRYEAIELGARKWEPSPAGDTWSRRYGDCKDKAVLLAAVLEAQGIRARPVLTCTRNARDIDPEWPDPHQFNHCIVAIEWPTPHPPETVTMTSPSGRRWTFFDPTSDYLPLGELHPAVAGAWGLIADPAEGLVRIPEGKRARVARVIRGSLDFQGTLHGEWVETASGFAAALLADAFDQVADKVRRERARTMLAGPWPEAIVDTVEWMGGASAAETTTLKVRFTIVGAGRRSGDRLVFRPIFLDARRAPVAADTSRTRPVWLGWPADIEDRFELSYPSGYQAEAADPVEWSGVCGRYRLTSSASPGLILMTRALSLEEEVVPAARFAEVRALWRAQYRGDNSPIVLRVP
jgi:hypothetical protein